LYDQSLIAEGSPLEDPADFARRLTALVERATAAPA
jgi:HSP90 family molecular chaperone